MIKRILSLIKKGKVFYEGDEGIFYYHGNKYLAYVGGYPMQMKEGFIIRGSVVLLPGSYIIHTGNFAIEKYVGKKEEIVKDLIRGFINADLHI